MNDEQKNDRNLLETAAAAYWQVSPILEARRRWEPGHLHC